MPPIAQPVISPTSLMSFAAAESTSINDSFTPSSIINEYYYNHREKIEYLKNILKNTSYTIQHNTKLHNTNINRCHIAGMIN